MFFACLNLLIILTQIKTVGSIVEIFAWFLNGNNAYVSLLNKILALEDIYLCVLKLVSSFVFGGLSNAFSGPMEIVIYLFIINVVQTFSDLPTVELTLHYWNKSQLIMMCYFLNVVLDSIC